MAEFFRAVMLDMSCISKDRCDIINKKWLHTVDGMISMKTKFLNHLHMPDVNLSIFQPEAKGF